MSRYTFEALSAQDHSFLVSEDTNHPMHVAACQILEVGGMRSPAGGIDIDRYKRSVAAVLHRIPRCRQKLYQAPILMRPVWVDDDHFSIDYHIRHAALPKPGGKDELRRLTARIMTRPLDRERPLWELWIIEGLEGDRFAVVSKIHHCMIDGAAGADISQILMSPSREAEEAPVAPYFPKPLPSLAELLWDEAKGWVTLPFKVANGVRSFIEDSEDWRSELGTRARALGEFVRLAANPSSDTPLNGDLGPHRRVDFWSVPLSHVKAVRRARECTINDVVLTTVTGAVRSYLIQRGVDPATIDFRVSTPVSTRTTANEGKLGNHVSSWVVPLPIATADPLEQLERIRATTREFKESRQALAVEMLMSAFEVAPPSVMAAASRAASGPMNAIVTNVPGPQFPLYVLGARLQETIPFVPLLPGTGLGIALFSYDGTLSWGFNADYELVPDIETFAEHVRTAFSILASSCGVELLEPVKPGASALDAA